MAIADPKTIARSGIIALIIKVLGAICTYGMLIALANLLSPEEFGRFAYGLNGAIIFASLAGLGFSTGIMRYVPQFSASGNFAAVKGVAFAGFYVVLAGSVVVAVLTMLLAQMQSFETNIFMLCVVLLGGAICVSDYATNLLRSLGSTVVSMLPRDVLWRVVTPALVLAAVWLGYDGQAPLALAVAASVLIVLNLWQLWAAWHMLPPGQGTFESDSIRTSLAPFWLASLIYAMIQQFDVVIIGTLLQQSEAGSYFAAQKTAQLLSLVLVAGGQATIPSMAALFHSEKLEQLQKLCKQLAAAIFAVTLIGFACVVIFGAFMLAIFDTSFVAAYPVLVVLAVAALVDAFAGPTALLMQMTKLEKTYIWIMSICYALVILGQVILIPLYGIIGAAFASATGTILWNLLAIFWLRKKVNLDPSLLAFIVSPVIQSPHGRPKT